MVPLVVGAGAGTGSFTGLGCVEVLTVELAESPIGVVVEVPILELADLSVGEAVELAPSGQIVKTLVTTLQTDGPAVRLILTSTVLGS